MTRQWFAAVVMVPVLALGWTSTARADDPAREIAEKATKAGAALFNARDAHGLAATYAEDARLEIINRDSAGALKTEPKVGRTEIESYYDNLFKSGGPIHARNSVEFARTISNDLITFTGVFVPDTQAEKPLKLPFIQVREKQGDVWRIVSLQLFIIPDSEK
jgi:hypothetical protein